MIKAILFTTTCLTTLFQIRKTFLLGKVEYISIRGIERQLVAHNTSYIFILPEVIADIVHHPALQYANGTPFYHIVAEPYSKPIREFYIPSKKKKNLVFTDISPQFLYFFPTIMSQRFFTLWDRLVESGISVQIEQRSIVTYKMIRESWLRSELLSRSLDLTELQMEIDGSQIMLMVFLIGFGYSLAGIVFVFELVWKSNRLTRRK